MDIAATGIRPIHMAVIIHLMDIILMATILMETTKITIDDSIF